jgi:hypothetical protein
VTITKQSPTNIQRQSEPKLGAERQQKVRAAVRIASMSVLKASLVENLHGSDYACDPKMSSEG